MMTGSRLPGVLVVVVVLPVSCGCTFNRSGLAPPGSECGNLVIEPGEDCEGGNLDGATCEGLGYVRGVLACSTSCAFDPTGCVAANCGNGQLEKPEQCDGPDLGGEDCLSQGYFDGTLACTGNCFFDHSGCFHESCGNGRIDGEEACDGLDLGGKSCVSLGYYGGDLSCSPNCHLDLTDCQAAGRCGDGMVQPNEEKCDGADLGGATCADFNYHGGQLACTSQCRFDQSDCQAAGWCGDGVVQPGFEECDGNDVGGQTCEQLGYYGGTLFCSGSCVLNRTSCEAAGWCGDGVLQPAHEDCEGADLNGADCTDFGYTQSAGLSCNADCSFNNAGCNCVDDSECDAGYQCTGTDCHWVAGDQCATAPVFTNSVTFVGHRTTNLTKNYNGKGCGLIAGGDNTDGPDRVYAVTLNAGDYVVAWVSPAGDWDAAIYLSSDCANIEGSCVAGSHRADEDGARQRLDYAAPSAGTYYLVVDGDTNGDEGSYDLDIDLGGPVVDAGSPGEVAFTEIMPLAGGSNKCEWFEIFNTTAAALNLKGLRFYDRTDHSFDITADLILRPGEHMVMCREPKPSTNCGLEWISWVGEGMDLLDGANTIKIERIAGSVVIDQVAYDGGWPYTADHSMYLCANHLNASDNDSPGNYQTASNPYNAANGVYGTPAAPDTATCN